MKFIGSSYFNISKNSNYKIKNMDIHLNRLLVESKKLGFELLEVGIASRKGSVCSLDEVQAHVSSRPLLHI